VRRNDARCGLCEAQLWTPVIRRSARWRIAVDRNHNLLGKLIVVLGRHEESVSGLTCDEWGELLGELRWATERLDAAFAPDHFNHAFLQNQDRHVHLHVIPRYAGQRSFAGCDFSDPDYPHHYTPGVERRVGADVYEAIATALG
jgi:diadenosine tetraphosphate (Ap4A) HIT family hydrolase